MLLHSIISPVRQERKLSSILFDIIHQSMFQLNDQPDLTQVAPQVIFCLSVVAKRN